MFKHNQKLVSSLHPLLPVSQAAASSAPGLSELMLCMSRQVLPGCGIRMALWWMNACQRSTRLQWVARWQEVQRKGFPWV